VNLLALDTSTIRAHIALLRTDGQVLGTTTDPASRHGRALVPAIHALLDEAGLRPSDLDRVAIGLGPGSFTGLRIGLAAAKVLAYAARLELAGFESLDLYASVPDDPQAPVAIVAEAQRGELYLARFGPPSHMRLTPTAIVPRSELDTLPPGTWLVGPALDRPSAAWPGHLLRPDPGRNRPSTQTLLHLAQSAPLIPDFWDLEPAYLRRSAAEEKATAITTTTDRR
jgi:tRNA threonylcarbamoyladenosine biosynthesis protein TsaB